MPKLSVAIVLFKPQVSLLCRTLQSLADAVELAVSEKQLGDVTVGLIDNSDIPLDEATLLELPTSQHMHLEYVFGQGNVGYGRANNLFLLPSSAEFLLVLNPDVEFDKAALSMGLRIMQAHPWIGLLAPAIEEKSGRVMTVCKRYPSLFDLGLRGFAPCWLKAVFRQRLAHYVMQDTAAEPR